MTDSAPVLLAAAAGVGLAHAVLPDHWLPLATIGRARHWPLRRVARLSALAGVGHVLLSIVLGAIVVAVGLQFRAEVRSAQDEIVGGLLVLTGLAFLVLQVRGHGHSHPHGHDHAHHHHEHESHDQRHDHHHEHEHRRTGILALLVPFGAAASPDLTILPVFLAATTAGVATAVGTVVLFGLVTIATFVVLTVIAAAGTRQIQAHWIDHYGNAITGVVLLVIGGLVAAGLL